MSDPSGRILINSLPKSGTHLLAQAVALFGYREHFAGDGARETVRPTPMFLNYREVKEALAGRDGREVPVAAGSSDPAPAEDGAPIAVGALAPVPVPLPAFRHWLAVLPKGCYILGHLPWTAALSPLLSELEYRHVFIIRDPRAVAVSLIDFILDSGKMPRRHFLEADFKDRDPAQRLDFVLKGGHAARAGVEVQDFATVYRSMLNWREAPDCLLLRYEDLVGAAGGGRAETQRQAVERLAGHLGAPLDGPVIGRLGEIYNPGARTFRHGSIDGWRRRLDAAGLERLREYCEPLCRAAGYEA